MADAIPEAWSGKEKLKAPNDFTRYETVAYWLNSYKKLTWDIPEKSPTYTETPGIPMSLIDPKELKYKETNIATFGEGLKPYFSDMEASSKKMDGEIMALISELYPKEDRFEKANWFCNKIVNAHEERSGTKNAQELDLLTFGLGNMNGEVHYTVCTKRNLDYQLSGAEGHPRYLVDDLGHILIQIELLDRLKQIKAQKEGTKRASKNKLSTLQEDVTEEN